MIGFDQVSGYLGNVSPGLIMAIVGVTIAFFLILIITFIWRRAVASKVRSAEGFTGMGFGDVENMRRSGMINEEEYKTIKRKVAERALAESKERESGAEAQLIMMQAAVDPDIVRKLLPDEIQEKSAEEVEVKPRAKVPVTAPRRIEPVEMAKPAAKTEIPEEIAGDPLAGLPSESAPKPAMNMRRVVAEKAKHAAGEEKGELDVLLEKGAITQDQYDKLKGYFKKPE